MSWNTHPDVKRAEAFATVAHSGQTRKFGGEPYINHPCRVASTVHNWHGTTDMVCAAVLHDVIEDCGVTYKQIMTMFGPNVGLLVMALTDQAPAYLNREKRKAWEAGRYFNESKGVHTIKLADLIDNTRDIVKHDPGFAKVYLAEKRVLLGSLTKGNFVLLRDAWKQVLDGEKTLGIQV